MMQQPFEVFVSYRREDVRGHAGRIRDALVGRFGREHVFYDLVSIEGGADFAKAIEKAIERSDVVVAVIGPRWRRLGMVRRLIGRHDWVATELQLARRLGKPVLPLLVAGAEVPRALPVGLTYLSSVNGFLLRDESWDEDVQRLLDRLPLVPATSEIPESESRQSRRPFAVFAAAALGILLAVIGAWWAMVNNAGPGRTEGNGAATPTGNAPSTVSSPPRTQSSGSDSAPTKPADSPTSPLPSRVSYALDGLICITGAPGAKNPLAARVASLSKPGFSVNKEQHVLLGSSGQPVSPVPAAHVGTLKQHALIVVHYTAGSKRAAERVMQDGMINQASAHVIVGRDGAVSQLAPFDVSTFHAGSSRWNGASVNASSISIELENLGSTTEGFQRYTDVQLRSFFDVACALRTAYPTIDTMVGHSDLDKRRLDPGPAFPMEELRSLLFSEASRR